MGRALLLYLNIFTMSNTGIQETWYYAYDLGLLKQTELHGSSHIRDHT
jgi:hypothetical protein